MTEISKARRVVMAELFAATPQRPGRVEQAVLLAQARRAAIWTPERQRLRWYGLAVGPDDAVAAASFIALSDTSWWAHAAWHYVRRHPAKAEMVAAYLALDGRVMPRSAREGITRRGFLDPLDAVIKCGWHDIEADGQTGAVDMGEVGSRLGKLAADRPELLRADAARGSAGQPGRTVEELTPADWEKVLGYTA